MFVLASKDPAEAALAPRMALAGGVMVLGQVLTAIGVIGSTTFPSCQTSDQCERGTWCDRAGGAWSAHLHKATGTQRCHVCGDDLPLPLQVSADGKSWNQPDDVYRFAGYNLYAMPSACRASRRRRRRQSSDYPTGTVTHKFYAAFVTARRSKPCAKSQLPMLLESRAWDPRLRLPLRRCRAGVQRACTQRPFAWIR